MLGLLVPAHRIRTLVVWLSVGSGAFSLYLMMSWLPTLLAQARWSTVEATRGTAAVQLGGIFGSLLIASAIDRGHLLQAVLCGYGCSVLALLAIGLVPGSVTSWQILLLLAGAGTSGMQAVWMAIAVVLYPLELRATSAGWVSCMSRIGAVAGPLVGGAAIGAAIEPRHFCSRWSCRWASRPSRSSWRVVTSSRRLSSVQQLTHDPDLNSLPAFLPPTCAISRIAPTSSIA